VMISKREMELESKVMVIMIGLRWLCLDSHTRRRLSGGKGGGYRQTLISIAAGRKTDGTENKLTQP
jgi:hypothetical protein